MALPHRDFIDLIIRTLVGHSDDNSFLSIDKFTNDHVELGHWGWFYEDTTPPEKSFWKWHVLVRSESAALDESMDQAVDYGMSLTLGISANTENCSEYIFDSNTMHYPLLTDDPPTWDKDRVTGKYYDGVQAWGDYPQSGSHLGLYAPKLYYADRPYSLFLWQLSYDAGAWGNIYAERFCRNGVLFMVKNIAGCDNPWESGDVLDGYIQTQLMRINFLNPVVNNLSQRSAPAGSTPTLILTGLGFNQSNEELNSKERNPLNAVGLDWESLVDYIDFIGLQGQGTFNLSRVLGDFTVDSDTKITINNFPSLPLGTYDIRLQKANVIPGVGITVYAYAGDWTCDAKGLCFPGSRIQFFMGEGDRTHREGSPIVLTDWQLKDKLDLSFIKRSYAPKDVCSTAKFHDGRLSEISGLQRAVNDETGLFISSDMSAKLVNVDKEFSKLLAQYYFVNEPIEMYLAFQKYPESFKSQFFRGFVEDHSLKGGEFNVSIRDLTTVFFQRKVPFYRITKEEYPSAHTSAIGRPMQEAIGKLSYIATEASGAMEAFLVDTTTYKYLAARGSLKAIPQVYKDGALVSSGYSIVYADGGRTYIDFTTDQGEAKITYNCEGYMYDEWNSVNGYVQHPIYVFLFYLMLIIGVPVNYVDFASFETVKEILDNLDPAIATSGYLGLLDEQDSMGVTQEFCQTIGGSLFPDRFGRLKLAMKDISNISTSKFIFSGIDTIDPPQQDWNYKAAVNRVIVEWNYIPAASRYLGSKEEERADAVDALSGNRKESKQSIRMKWTTNETLAEKQMFNTLYKRGKGYKKIKFQLPLTFVDYLDIYDSFRLQDPFGVSVDGSGDYGRFLYVEKISFEWIGSLMEIEALDLTYILRRYLVLGDENKLPSNWSATTEESKAYAYLCNETTGKFADGELGKILVDENKIAM
jgi:hypothetical protein